MKTLSIVVPVYNEEEVLPEFIRRASSLRHRLAEVVEVDFIFVNDGSTDKSIEILRTVGVRELDCKVVALSRNFGHQEALCAGYDHAAGDAVVSIDCDLQDPPEVIDEMVRLWIGGADVVLGRRIHRKGESWPKLLSASLHYRALNRLTGGMIPENVGDFRLMSREALSRLRSIEEDRPYLRGLVSWIGFRQEIVNYERHERQAGSTKYSLRKMTKLSIAGLTSFSERPLEAISIVGLFTVAVSVFGAAWTVVGKIIEPSRSVSGYATLLIAVLFIGGVQLLSLGVLGLYFAVASRNIKKRPRYIIWEAKSKLD